MHYNVYIEFFIFGGDFLSGVHFYEKIKFNDILFPISIQLDRTISYKEDSSHPDDRHWHEQLEVLYVLDGKLSVKCGYRHYICDQGDAIIINPCEPHRVDYHSGNPKFHCILIDPKLYESGILDLCELKYLMKMNGKSLVFNNLIRDNCNVTSILEVLFSECRAEEYAYEVAVKGNILRLLAELFRTEISNTVTQNNNISTKSGFSLIEPVFNYIAEHYSEKITLTKLADICCVNASHLCRVFKKVTDKTIMDYLTEYRIGKAGVLLLTTDKSIGEIAYETGYTDSGHFSRSFKSVYGISPIKFKKTGQHHESEDNNNE